MFMFRLILGMYLVFIFILFYAYESNFAISLQATTNVKQSFDFVSQIVLVIEKTFLKLEAQILASSQF